MLPVPVELKVTEVLLLKLAREIAMDIHELDDILKRYSIDAETWAQIQINNAFKNYLISEVEAWNTALNTHERVRVKSAAMIEEWLPELNNRIHDQKENLTAKIEAGKLVARLADMGLAKAGFEGGGGERFSVTINLGASEKLTFSKDVTPKVIEGTVGST